MRFPKRLAAVLPLAFAVAGLTACATLRTTTDYDPRADLTRYRTFDVEKVSSRRDDLLARRIEGALVAELSGKGLHESDRDADLVVVAYTRLDHQTRIYTYGSGWGYGWRWRGGPAMSISTVEKIPVGMLIVDLVDAKSHELVWRSTASDALDPGATPEKREREIAQAVSKMFETYPRI